MYSLYYKNTNGAEQASRNLYTGGGRFDGMPKNRVTFETAPAAIRVARHNVGVLNPSHE